MSSWARPGVKCVCVDAVVEDTCPGEPVPVEGAVYTIRSVEHDKYGRLGLLLVELVGPEVITDEGVCERTFLIGRFRPLVTKSQEQDVALFTHLLTGKPVEVDA